MSAFEKDDPTAGLQAELDALLDDVLARDGEASERRKPRFGKPRMYEFSLNIAFVASPEEGSAASTMSPHESAEMLLQALRNCLERHYFAGMDEDPSFRHMVLGRVVKALEVKDE